MQALKGGLVQNVEAGTELVAEGLPVTVICRLQVRGSALDIYWG